jgi:hypothetical protein
MQRVYEFNCSPFNTFVADDYEEIHGLKPIRSKLLYLKPKGLGLYELESVATVVRN